ncbi:MAG: glycosyltransferase family 2 protein [Nitrososphaerota archaeon]|nr:glycosyltransferase family 2 protein [Nitrososphaerota archaeon]
MPAEKMDVLVPAFNEYSRDTSRFESRLRYFSGLAERWRTVLVDDGSDDGTLERTERFVARTGSHLELVAAGKNQGKEDALTLGLEKCPGPLVLQMDFDATVDAGVVSARGEELLSQDDAGAFGFRLATGGNSILAGLQDLEYALEAVARTERFSAEGRIGFAQGAGVLWKRAVLARALEAHSGVHNGGDAELSALAYAAGYRTLYDPGVVVETPPACGLVQLVKQRARWYARTRLTIWNGARAAGPSKLAGDARRLLTNRTYVGEQKDLALLPLFPFYKLSLIAMATVGRRPQRALL